MTNPSIITIMNFGSCPRKAIELIGHSSKSGADTIGRFGSGTAYAVALALRLGVRITISSHDEQGPYTMQPYGRITPVGDAAVTQVIWRYRRGSPLMPSWWETAARAMSLPRSIPTSFSADLGRKDWDGAFPIVREFVSNAKDAGVWAINENIETFANKATAAGHTAITVVQIDDPSGECQAVLDSWNDYFRFDEHNAIFSKNGFSAIYPKPEASPLKVFIRGVRCPWPGRDTPMSLFDYSLEIELNEARSLKSPWCASLAMTQLWNDAVRHDPAIGAVLLNRLDDQDDTWEATNVNQYASSELNPWRKAWSLVHGDAPVAGPIDPVVPGAVKTTSAMRDFLSASGVATSKSRSVEVRRGDTVFVEVPSKTDTMMLEITIDEARELKQLLILHGRLDRVQALLPDDDANDANDDEIPF